MATFLSPDEDAPSVAETIRCMTTEDLLSVWEQSQKLFLALQTVLSPSVQPNGVTEGMIVAELLRRDTLRRQSLRGKGAEQTVPATPVALTSKPKADACPKACPVSKR